MHAQTRDQWLLNGTGGEPFGRQVIPRGAFVRRIFVHADGFIDGIQIEYVSETGCAGQLPYAGGLGGRRQVFELPDRARVLGFSVGGTDFLESLQIHTSKGTSRVFGRQEGERAFVGVERGCEFRGVFGRAGWYLDALGMVTVPASEMGMSDHLFHLPGIAPTTVRALEEVGIANCAKLAQSDPSEIVTVLRRRGIRARRDVIHRWRESAVRMAS